MFFVVESTVDRFEGDIELTAGQWGYVAAQARAEASKFGLQNAVLIPDLFDMWEDATVPYVIEGIGGKKTHFFSTPCAYLPHQ